MREDFMTRLDGEYQAYLDSMTALPGREIVERAGEIAGMTEVYSYFKHGSPSEDQVEYLAQAAHPLQEVYGFYTAYPHNDFEQIDLIVYDIRDKDLFSDPEIEKLHGDPPICFHRKPSDLTELKSFKPSQEADKFKVEKIIALTPEQFLHFSRNLIADSPIIEQNQSAMWHDGACWHCLLVHSPGVSDSILVESEGYHYARYCAYVSDYRKLDLKDVPIVKYDRRPAHRDHKPSNRDDR